LKNFIWGESGDFNAASSNFHMIVCVNCFLCFKHKLKVKKFYTFCVRVQALAQSDGRFVKV